MCQHTYHLLVQIAAERVKGDSSEWQPYLACLPSDISFMPLMWPAADIQQLQHQLTIADIEARRQWVHDFARALAADGATFDDVEVNEVLLGDAFSPTYCSTCCKPVPTQRQ